MKTSCFYSVPCFIKCFFRFQFDYEHLDPDQLDSLFDDISRDQLVYSDDFNSPHFAHLYNFQKFCLSNSLEYFTDLVRSNIQRNLDDEIEPAPVNEQGLTFLR